MEQQWYIARNKQKIGPYSIEQMQQMATIGELLRNEMVLDSSQKKWCLADTVEDIFSPVIKTVAPIQAPLPTPASPSLLPRYPVLIGTLMVLVLLLCGFFFGLNKKKPHVPVDGEMLVAEKSEGPKSPVVMQESSTLKEESVKPEEPKSKMVKEEPGNPKEESVKPEEPKSQVVKEEPGKPKEGSVKPEETKSQAEAKKLFDAGGVFLSKGLLEEAIKRYSESIKLDPSSSGGYDMRAYAFERAGKHSEAIADRTIVLEFFLLETPQKPEAIKRILVARGLSYIDLGKHSEGRNDYTKAIKIDPDDANPYVCRGLSYYSTSKFDEAISDLNKAIDLSGKAYKGTTELYYRGKSYLALDKKDEGIADLAKAKLIDPKYFSDLELVESKRSANKNNTAAPKVEIINLDKDVKLEMVLVPAGKFMMGSPASEKGHEDNETQHEVTLTKPFYMGKYEVTQEQWEAVTGNNPSNTKGAKLPVTDVSWEDCQEFIKKLNAKTGGGYRLPTEAEWEYACRAGTTTAYSFGEKISITDANITISDSDEIALVLVGSYKANAFGLYDMHGNVWEFCEDWFGDYPTGAVTDPRGAAKGERRILRGGAYIFNQNGARSSKRYRKEPDEKISLRFGTKPEDFFSFNGFRLVRAADNRAGVVSPTETKPDATGVTPSTRGLLVAPFTETKAKEVQKEVAKSLKKEVEEREDLGKGIKLDMVLIPAGKFKMGSPEGGHEVTLTKAFYMGKYEVTQEQWEGVMKNNPSITKGAKLPVENVSWEDCQEFIKKLNAKTNGGYRLPTEAEWEYSCRAGTTTAYSYGDSITKDDANVGGGSLKAVGGYKPNAFGLYDMHGNVQEWCEDWYGEYPKGAVTDPMGPGTGKAVVYRGGSFGEGGVLVSCSDSRNFRQPFIKYDGLGFRLARIADSKASVALPSETKPDPAGVIPAISDTGERTAKQISYGRGLAINIISKMNLETFLKNHPKAKESEKGSNPKIGYLEYTEGFFTYGFLNGTMIVDSYLLPRSETSWKPIIEEAMDKLGKPDFDQLSDDAKKAGIILTYQYYLKDPDVTIRYHLEKYDGSTKLLGVSVPYGVGQTVIDEKAFNVVIGNINPNKGAKNSISPIVKMDLTNVAAAIEKEMVLIPAGKFMMGSPASELGRRDDEVQHEVTFSKSYYMGKYEVTQEQWDVVMGDNPNKTKGIQLPVTSVSWEDCQEFIKKLNLKTNGGYRLPTEAEWEYACRAGTTTAYSYGDKLSRSDANIHGLSTASTKVVGSYKPNVFGLYDMHGNVYEWCEDYYGPYPEGSVTDPKGPATGKVRVLRGGSFNLIEWFARSSKRDSLALSARYNYNGFRLARTADSKASVASPTETKPDAVNIIPAAGDLLVAPFTEARAKEVQKEVAKSLKKEVEEKAELGKGVDLEMVLIPPGKFMMGSPDSEKRRRENEKQYEVKITKPFYMGKHEVTQEQWESVMGNNPSATKGAKLPVTFVSWEDCQEFIKKLNAKTNGGYRLPTEAEWEYACRAGTTTAYSFGDKITPKDANYDDSKIRKPVAVGSYKPNAFGLYDMHGNVSEWCEDWKADYPAGAATDPKGPAKGEDRVFRDGSFSDNDSIARSSVRHSITPTGQYIYNGFRLARTP